MNELLDLLLYGGIDGLFEGLFYLGIALAIISLTFGTIVNTLKNT